MLIIVCWLVVEPDEGVEPSYPIGDVTIYINRGVLVSLNESVQVVACLLQVLLRSSFVLVSAHVLDDVTLAEVQ